MWGKNNRPVASSAPAANAFARGWLAIVQGAAGVADVLQFVRKTAADTYELASVSTDDHTHATTYAPISAKYIVQTADASLTNEQATGALATGIVKNTTTTGVLSIAAAGTDYTSPTGTENLANKTLDNTNTVTIKDTLLTIQDDGDTTKQAKFQASVIATGTTRTYMLPNATGGLALIDTGYQTPPGPVVLGTTNVTALASEQCGARYLGMVPFDVSSVEVNVQVTTAAVTITWAEVALASANSASGGNLTLLGSATNVAATFNSTGVKTVTFSISVPAGTFLYFLFGSQATTPFQVRATLADELSLGVHRLASTTRPSTMAAPTAFSTSTAITGAAWCPFRWS